MATGKFWGKPSGGEVTKYGGVKGVSQAFAPKKRISLQPLFQWRYPAVWITLLGAVFRFLGLGGVRLTHDLAWQGWEAARIVNGVYPILGQPSSVFLDNPPLMGYIQAIPLFFWRSPWSIFIFITLLNTLAIPFVYDGVEKIFGRRVAILSATLFAINPWIVHFSRYTWTQGLMPIFLAVMFWGWGAVASRSVDQWLSFARSVSGAVSKRSGTDLPITDYRLPFLLSWLALTAMCMTYVLSLAMLAPAGLLVVIFWRRLPKKELATGIGVLVLSLAFYGWAVSQNLDQNSGKFFEFLDRAGDTEQIDEMDQFLNLNDDALKHAMRFVTGRDYVGQDFGGPDVDGPIPVPIVAQIARWGLTAAFLVGLLKLVFGRHFNSQQSTFNNQLSTWLLLIWFFVPIGLMMVLPSSVFVHPHYLLFTLPAGSVIAALGLDWCVSAGTSGEWRVVSSWLVIIFLIAIGMRFNLSLQQSSQASQSHPFARGLGSLPLSVAADLGDEIRAFYATSSDQTPQRIYLDANHQIVSAISGMWLESTKSLAPPAWELFPANGSMLSVLPTHQLPLNVDPISMLELEDRTSILLLEQDVFDPPGQPAERESEAGLTFLGYSQDIVGGDQIIVKSSWRVDVLHDARNEWFVSPFVHLIDENGQTVVNEAPYGQWGHRWRVGDIYVSTVTVERPADAVTLGIGLFDPISGRTFLLKHPEGGIPRFEYPLP